MTYVVDKSTTEVLTPNHFLIGNLYRATSTIDLDPQDDIQVRDVIIQLDPRTSWMQWKLAIAKEILPIENDKKYFNAK